MFMEWASFVTPLLGWQNQGGGGADGAALVGGLIGQLFGLVIAYAILGVLAYLHVQVLEKVPPQFRQLEPWQAWLLLIPCFNIVWIFMLYMKTPASLLAYAQSKGRGDLGDCGSQLGLWAAITQLCCGPIGLVVLVLYILKINDVAKQLST